MRWIAKRGRGEVATGEGRPVVIDARVGRFGADRELKRASQRRVTGGRGTQRIPEAEAAAVVDIDLPVEMVTFQQVGYRQGGPGGQAVRGVQGARRELIGRV